MLQIKDICKEYRTGSLVQKALDHVSLNLRNNEFVAILGPSGSGKTTLLNIIGGLDRYDSGDLIINGISTKRYKDRDWDSYRNHTIGFVFQSYNLIPHQTVLANVELALTISGISGNERRRRAEEALKKVGLGEQMHKKPAQMSGGQMQRVAIARALVNDPDILLADEPTGALDSETSVTIMDLLKEVASDRLVVMVTHNPELAEQYATRIVNLKDGHIIGDSDPFNINEEDEDEPVHRNMGKASMSFLTALSLSFNNLRTKLTRTVLVAFAGSIGIIGIALIMSLSNGVNRYIKDIEEETLLEYPLEIQNSSISLSSLIETPEGNDEEKEEKEPADVTERRIASTMFSRVSSNDLGALKDYFETDECNIEDYTKAIEYSYNVVPLIYRMEGENARQVNPDTSFSSLGFSSTSLLFSSAWNTDVFRSFPKDEQLYKNSYDLKAGRWAENYNECMLVLSSTGRVTDTMLYTLGLKDADELTRMMEAFSAGENVKEEEGPLLEFSYEDFVGISFKLVNSFEKYVYDGEYDVWTDKSDDKKYINRLASEGEDLVITGVLMPSEDASVTMLMQGIYYPESLIHHVIEQSAESRITRMQLLHSGKNVFTGKDFNAPRDENEGLNLETLFTVDRNALANVFSFDASKLSMDTSAFENMDMSDMNVEGMIDPNAMQKAMPDMSDIDISSIMKDVNIKVSQEALQKMVVDLYDGFVNDEESKKKLEELTGSFRKYMAGKDGGNAETILKRHIALMIVDFNKGFITKEVMTDFISTIMSGFPSYVAEMHGYPVGNAEDPETSKEEMLALLTGYINAPTTQEKITQAISDMILSEIQESDIPTTLIAALAGSLTEDYEQWAAERQAPSLKSFSEIFAAYLNSPAGRKILEEGMRKSFNYEEVQKQISRNIESMAKDMTDGITKGITDMLKSFMTKFTEQLTKKITDAMTSSTQQMASNMNKAFSIHPEAFANAISMNMDEQELSELLTSLMSVQPATYDSNLKALGYADVKKPYSITIYPKDFESKAEIINIVDSYNERMQEEDESKVITYTDTVGLLMTSVTDIINAISYVLIAFVAISLVVSSIMIGVITYISVLERRKEIGILRAIGASKRNVSSVFNAETFIIGLLAGLFGIGISLLLLIPGNMLIHHFTDANVWARLPAEGGIALIILSVILTMIGGIIPSKKAANSDPVTALRTD